MTVRSADDARVAVVGGVPDGNVGTRGRVGVAVTVDLRTDFGVGGASSSGSTVDAARDERRWGGIGGRCSTGESALKEGKSRGR
jgi:hypothetical protein